MRRLALLLALVSCTQAPLVVEHYPAPAPGEPALKVTFTPESYGRSCADVIVRPDGEVWATLSVDATTDWIAGRVLPSALHGAVIAVAVAVSPTEVLRLLLGGEPPEFPGPSEIHGCGDLFRAEALSDVPEEERAGLWERVFGGE